MAAEHRGRGHGGDAQVPVPLHWIEDIVPAQIEPFPIAALKAWFKDLKAWRDAGVRGERTTTSSTGFTLNLFGVELSQLEVGAAFKDGSGGWGVQAQRAFGKDFRNEMFDTETQYFQGKLGPFGWRTAILFQAGQAYTPPSQAEIGAHAHPVQHRLGQLRAGLTGGKK